MSLLRIKTTKCMEMTSYGISKEYHKKWVLWVLLIVLHTKPLRIEYYMEKRTTFWKTCNIFHILIFQNAKMHAKHPLLWFKTPFPGICLVCVIWCVLATITLKRIKTPYMGKKKTILPKTCLENLFFYLFTHQNVKRHAKTI